MEYPPCRPPSPMSRVLVLGAGNFGSCLADHLADSEHRVILWCREVEVRDSLNSTKKNPKYLTDHVFPDRLEAIGPDLPNDQLLSSIDVVIFAIPTQYLRPILTQLRDPLFGSAKLRQSPIPWSDDKGEKSTKEEDKLPLLIFVNKGIETDTQALTLEIIVDAFGPEMGKVSAFISGPSFAKEIVKRQPTSVTVASLSKIHAERASNLFHQPWFRCYTHDDPIGVELAGALKNIYAIAAGIADGMGFLSNTKAAIITRALAEMTRIGVAYGADPLTFLGLAGVGDLLLTCNSPNSRNYTVGFRLGKGEKLEDIIATLGSVAEGVTTAKGAKKIVDELGVNAPLVKGVYSVLYEGTSAEEAATMLMNRPQTAELTLPNGGPVRALLTKIGLEPESTGA